MLKFSGVPFLWHPRAQQESYTDTNTFSFFSWLHANWYVLSIQFLLMCPSYVALFVNAFHYRFDSSVFFFHGATMPRVRSHTISRRPSSDEYPSYFEQILRWRLHEKSEDIFLDFHDVGWSCRSKTSAPSILPYGYADSAWSIQCCTKIAAHGTKDYTIRANKYPFNATRCKPNLQVQTNWLFSNLTNPVLLGVVFNFIINSTWSLRWQWVSASCHRLFDPGVELVAYTTWVILYAARRRCRAMW